MYLLDTNTLIYFFKQQGNVSERLLNTTPSEIAISLLTVYEIEVGLAKSSDPLRRRNQFEEFLSVVKLIPFDQNEARISAQLRAILEKIGKPIGPIDTLIAGSALAHGATLITHNLSEFERVPGLAVEDWF